MYHHLNVKLAEIHSMLINKCSLRSDEYRSQSASKFRGAKHCERMSRLLVCHLWLYWIMVLSPVKDNVHNVSLQCPAVPVRMQEAQIQNF